MIISPSTFNRCEPVIGSDCVIYSGSSIPCITFPVCQSPTVTDVVGAIGTQVCTLTALTNVSTLVIPPCFTASYGVNPPNIFNSLQILLNQVCLNEQNISTITTELTNLNPLVTLDYGCCSTNPCVTTGTVTLTTALQNILSCVCTQTSAISTLQGQIQTLTSQYNNLNTQYTSIQNTLISVQNQLNAFCVLVAGSSIPTDTNGLIGKVQCIISSLNNTPYPTGC